MARDNIYQSLTPAHLVQVWILSVLHSSGRLWHDRFLKQIIFMRLAVGHQPEVEISTLFIDDDGVWIFFLSLVVNIHPASI